MTNYLVFQVYLVIFMIYGLVSEFNPFHNGHKALIDKVKSEDNTIISVMSTSFVQRGDISIINKYDKTRAALMNGVDLILELPAVYSLSNAEIFGKASVDILKNTNSVDKILFGSECGNIDKLNTAIEALNNPDVQIRIKEYMDKGEYYPKAVYNSIREIYNEEISNIYSGANNVLGMEYIKAIKGSSIDAETYSRVGSGHDSKEATDNIASGSFIRNNYSDKELYIPDYPITDTAHIENIEKLIIYKLSSLTPQELKEIPDVDEGLENRIIEATKMYNSFEEICNSIKTKRYTMARIRRIMCNTLLGITKETKKLPVPYIRVLGFTSKGSKLLKNITLNSPVPVITNVKDGYDSLDSKGKKVMDIEILASRLWALASDHNTIIKNDFQQGIIKEG